MEGAKRGLDRGRRFCKPDTAARAPDRRQKTRVGKDVDDLEDVLLGDAETFGNISHFHELVARQRAVDQNAYGVTGLLRQAHCVLTRNRAAAAEKTNYVLVSQFALAWQGRGPLRPRGLGRIRS